MITSQSFTKNMKYTKVFTRLHFVIRLYAKVFTSKQTCIHLVAVGCIQVCC